MSGRRVSIRSLALASSLAAVALLGCQRSGSDQFKDALAKAKGLGMATSWKELDARDPIPDSENAALLLDDLDEPSPADNRYRLVGYDLTDPGDRSDLAEELGRNRKFLEQAERLLAMRRFRDLVENEHFKALGSGKWMAKVLLAQARLDLSNHNPEAALKRWKEGVHLEGLLMQNATMIHVLVAIAVQSIVESGLYAALNLYKDDARVIGQVEQIAGGFQEPPPLPSVIQAEVATVAEEAKSVKVTAGDASYVRLACDEWRGLAPDAPYDRSMVSKTKSIEDKWAADNKGTPGVNSDTRMYAPLVEAVLRLKARILLIKAVAEAVAYKHEHDVYPPTFPLTGINSIEPRSGQPFHYRVDGKGFLIYYPGYDGIDHGGSLPQRGSSMTGHDEGYAFPSVLPNVHI